MSWQTRILFECLQRGVSVKDSWPLENSIWSWAKMAPQQTPMECELGWRNSLEASFHADRLPAALPCALFYRMQYLLESSTWVERKPSGKDCGRSSRRRACDGFAAFTEEYKIHGCRQWGRHLFHFAFHSFVHLSYRSFPWNANLFLIANNQWMPAYYIHMIVFLAKL